MSEKLSQKKLRRQKARAARALDKRPGGVRELEPDSFLDDKGVRVKVMRRGVPLKGFEDHLVRAAARFAKDWNLANAGTLKGMPWKARVDGGGQAEHKIHLDRLDAQKRMGDVEKVLGARGMVLATGVCVFGFSATQIHKNGGPQRTEVVGAIKTVLRQLGEYYDRRPHRRDPMMDTLTEMIERAMQEAAAT
jgi:hypothetical protein